MTILERVQEYTEDDTGTKAPLEIIWLLIDVEAELKRLQEYEWMYKDLCD